MVPSLINRAYILDLAPGQSLLRYLAEQGLRPLLLDWDAPAEIERGFGLDEYIIERLEPAAAVARDATGRVPTVLGYCMGGLLALALAVRRPELVRALALLATPWRFHAERAEQAKLLGVLAEPIARSYASLGEVPVDVLQALFAAQDPLLALRKFSRFAEMPQDSAAARGFVALEDWLNDGVPLTIPVARGMLGRLVWRGPARPQPMVCRRQAHRAAWRRDPVAGHRPRAGSHRAAGDRGGAGRRIAAGRAADATAGPYRHDRWARRAHGGVGTAPCMAGQPRRRRGEGFQSADPALSNTQLNEPCFCRGGLSMSEIVIAGAARTPIGSFNGALSSLPAHELGKIAVAEAHETRQGRAGRSVGGRPRARSSPPARARTPRARPAVGAGIPYEVTAYIINQLCGSGLRAVALGYQAI